MPRRPLRTALINPLIHGLGMAAENGIPRRLRICSTSWKCCNSSMAMAFKSSTRLNISGYFSKLIDVVAAFLSRWA